MPSDNTYYNDSHRAFVQAFLTRSVMTFEEAQPVLAEILTRHEGRECLPADITPDILTQYVDAANTSLSPLDLEIRSTRSQKVDRTRVWALVNTTSDALTQLATVHTPAEIAFVKRVLDAMFDTFNTRRAEVMAVKATQAIRLHKENTTIGNSASTMMDQTQTTAISTVGIGTMPSSTSQGITMKEAERVMKLMVEEGWFEFSRNGFYSLTPRALMELRDWLVETYNEEEGDEDVDDGEGARRIKFCEVCRDIVTMGQRCSNYDCFCRLHNPCSQQFFRNQPESKCPSCSADWTGQDFVGESAVMGTSARGRRSRPSREGRESGISGGEAAGIMAAGPSNGILESEGNEGD